MQKFRLSLHLKPEKSVSGKAMEDFAPEQLDYYKRQYAAQKTVNIYYLTCEEGGTGRQIYAYVAVNALLHDDFLASIRLNVLPAFCVVVEKGYVPPDEATTQKMKDYYGFDHAAAAVNGAAYRLEKPAF